VIKVDEYRGAGALTPKMEKVSPQLPAINPSELELAVKLFAQHKTTRWFDLDHYSRYRDPLLVAGFIMIIGAVSHYSGWGALALFGAGMIYVGYLMGK